MNSHLFPLFIAWYYTLVIRSITRVQYHQLTWYNSLWLWRWLSHRLSKCQSLSTTTVLFRTTFDRTIKLNLLSKWFLGSNLSQFYDRYSWLKAVVCNMQQHNKAALLVEKTIRPFFPEFVFKQKTSHQQHM